MTQPPRKITARQREPAGKSPDSQIFRGRFASVAHFFIAHLGALIKGAEARLLNGRDMHEDILAAAVRLNKPIALCRVEPLHCAYRHVYSPYQFENTK